MKSNLKALLKNPSAMIGAGIITVVILLALLAPLLGGDPNFVDPVNRLKSPG